MCCYWLTCQNSHTAVLPLSPAHHDLQCISQMHLTISSQFYPLSQGELHMRIEAYIILRSQSCERCAGRASPETMLLSSLQAKNTNAGPYSLGMAARLTGVCVPNFSTFSSGKLSTISGVLRSKHQ